MEKEVIKITKGPLQSKMSMVANQCFIVFLSQIIIYLCYNCVK